MPPLPAQTLTPARLARTVTLLLALTLLLVACGRNMADQPRAEWNEASPFFADGAAARPIPEDTVSRERGDLTPAFRTGIGPDGPLEELPVELDLDLLRRGQERYNVFCSPCHDYDGSGGGMIVQKGFPQPTSFHESRLLNAPVGQFVNAMANGFGRMYSYASRVPPEDRWAIAAYVRALQLSQNAALDDIPSDVLEGLPSREGAAQ